MSAAVKEIASQMERVVCACDTCVGFCKKSPCWGTPEETQKIIDAGLGDRLSVHTGYFYKLLAPAVIGWEGKTDQTRNRGRCTFLNQDDRCELHALGLKPIEAVMASHVAQPLYEELVDAVSAAWDNGQGQALVNKWEEEYK